MSESSFAPDSCSPALERPLSGGDSIGAVAAAAVADAVVVVVAEEELLEAEESRAAPPPPPPEPPDMYDAAAAVGRISTVGGYSAAGCAPIRGP